MAVGDKVILPDGEWPIVGIFATGDLLDGQLVGDTETVMPALRHKTFNTVLVRLEFAGRLRHVPRGADHQSAADGGCDAAAGLERQGQRPISPPFRASSSMASGVILAIGALFGCFNTMYAAVESRGREIATLRALGYGGLPIAAFGAAGGGGAVGRRRADRRRASPGRCMTGCRAAWVRMSSCLTVSPAMVGIGVSVGGGGGFSGRAAAIHPGGALERGRRITGAISPFFQRYFMG